MYRRFVLLALLVIVLTIQSSFCQVVDLTSSNFDKTVLQSEGIWMVAFIAPWCGHCKRLHPEYDKAAESLGGVVNLGRVNCDDEKELAHRFGVQGFPTIKIFNAGKEAKKSPEDYQYARTAGALVNTVMSKFNSLADPVKKLDDLQVVKQFVENTATSRAILLTSKDSNPSLFKSIAVELKNRDVSLAYIPNKAQSTVLSAIDSDLKAPALLLYTKDSTSFIKYDGKMKKYEILKFLESNIPGTEANKEKVRAQQKAEEQRKKEQVVIETIKSVEELRSVCDKMCVFTIADSSDTDKKKLFTELAQQYKKKELRFAIVETNNADFKNAFDIQSVDTETTSIPVVVFRGGKSKYSSKNDVTKENAEWFFEQILYGGLKFSPLEVDIPSLTSHDEL